MRKLHLLLATTRIESVPSDHQNTTKNSPRKLTYLYSWWLRTNPVEKYAQVTLYHFPNFVGWNVISKQNETTTLKIAGWKTNFPSEMVPFQMTLVHFRGWYSPQRHWPSATWFTQPEFNCRKLPLWNPTVIPPGFCWKKLDLCQQPGTIPASRTSFVCHLGDAMQYPWRDKKQIKTLI